MLTDCLQMRTLYVGSDFAPGAGREGTPARLRQAGLDVRTQPLVMAAGGSDKVSSSSIRQMISRGTSLSHASSSHSHDAWTRPQELSFSPP